METGQQHSDEHKRAVSVSVNEQPVTLHGDTATGAEIKAAAIAQGVHIQPNFVLKEELPNGASRVIDDCDRVHLREHLRFTAIAPEVTVLVNDKPVKLHGKTATGAEIKAAAIAQGVHIQPNFVLHEKLPDGTSRVIGDNDTVHLREHLRFTAIAPEVTVSVNEQPVKLQGETATGNEIKAAAIAQGVLIQLNFILQEELPNGTSRVIGDNDTVHLREHLRFTAIAPDDNS
jgi:hypothetical protein